MTTLLVRIVHRGSDRWPLLVIDPCSSHDGRSTEKVLRESSVATIIRSTIQW